MKKELTLIEISDDSPIKEWATILMGERNAEARATLEAEGVIAESCFYFDIDGKKYLAFYMEGDQIIPGNKDIPINKKHQEVIQSIKLRRKDATLLYSLLPIKESS